MNDKELQNAVKAITLPEESRRNMIRKLDQISREENVFQAEPARFPIFRYVLTGVLVCAILTISTGGILHLTRTQSGSQFEPGGSIENLDNRTNSVFEVSSENQVYAITQESGTQYFSVSESDKKDLLENLQSVLTNHASDFQTDFMVGGSKEFIIYLKSGWIDFWKDGDSSFIVIKKLKDSEEQMYCLEISSEEYDSIKAMLAEPEAYFDLPYEDQNAVFYGNLEQEILEYIFQEKVSPFGDVSQMQERLIFSEYKHKYVIPTEEQHQKLADLLNQTEWKKVEKADIDPNLLNYDGSFFTIYFNTPEERFTVHFSSYITVTRDNSQEVYESGDLVSQICDMFLPADTLYELNTEKKNIFEQIFDDEPIEDVRQEKISPFGDVSQMQERLIFVEYAPLYLIPTEEQHQKLAELLNNADFEQLSVDDARIPELEQGEFFTIYFDAPEERFTVRFHMSGLIIESSQGFYYNPELISEIRDLFVPAETLYQLNPVDVLYELNINQIFEQMFDEEPIEFQQSCVVRIPDMPILIHDESFSRDAQGNYHMENDTQYVISQEQKQQLSDFIASQELQAIVGFPDFEKGEHYQKFVVEFTEEDGFLTLEYDVENEQYYLILCSQMEIPGEPVETGEYCYFPVTEEFYQNWNALLMNQEN